MCVIFCRRRRNNGNSWPRSAQHWWWRLQVTGVRRCIWGRGEVGVVGKSLRPRWSWWRLCFEPFCLLWCSICVFLTLHTDSICMGIWSLCFAIWIQSSHSFVVCIWTNAGISLKASPFHQVSHLFWGQNGLPTFCSYLGELKGKMGKEDLRVLKAFQDINVFSRKSDPERQSLLKSFDSVFTDWQMFWWSWGQKQLQSCLLNRRTSCVKSMLTCILV